MTQNQETITTYKGFNQDFTCRGFQYEIGKTYTHDGVIRACISGFHACEHPLDVLGYYPPSRSRYAVVEQSGDLNRENADDSKVASSSICLKFEISIADLIKFAVDYTFSKCTPINPKSPSFSDMEYGQGESIDYRGVASTTGEYSVASSTGYNSAASTTGEYSAASTTGEYSVASSTGYKNVSSATGEYSVASTTGEYSAASTTGNYGAASTTGYRSVAFTTGKYGAASTTGNRGIASSTGYYGAALSTGDYGVASTTGYKNVASVTGDYGAASTTGDYSSASATGEYSSASATGYHSVAFSTGYRSEASSTGEQSVACGLGWQNKAKASETGAIVLTYRNTKDEIIHIRASKVGENGIKPDTWYQLDENGEFVEVRESSNEKSN